MNLATVVQLMAVVITADVVAVFVALVVKRRLDRRRRELRMKANVLAAATAHPVSIVLDQGSSPYSGRLDLIGHVDPRQVRR